MQILEHLKPVTIINLNIFGFDISLTNGALIGLLAVVIILLFFHSVSRKIKMRPSFSQTIAEFILQFLNDEMLSPLGEKAEAWLPFIASIFCFILVCNLLGLIPGFVPPTSNINVTAALAVIVFIVVQAAGIKSKGIFGYFMSLIPPGVPVYLAPFLFPIELVGQIARPFSLAVRLFANMFAGHAIILTLISMIFIFKSYLVIPFPVIGNVAIMGFELFVSFIQAFIFSFLAATYIVGALQTEH